jgi:hypothetical protein
VDGWATLSESTQAERTDEKRVDLLAEQLDLKDDLWVDMLVDWLVE